MKKEEKSFSASDKIIGGSLINLKKLVAKFAEEKQNILLAGERGTGKELFAELYFEASGYKKFVPINCAGLSDQILHSELFGHTKGSFTGADRPRDGIFKKYNDDSIIFLDEIGDASESLQATLLRVLETGDYKPLGADKVEKITGNLLIIAATSKPKNVRSDLVDRFACIQIPPLRSRREDLPELIKSFSKELSVKKISRKALKKLKSKKYEGNIRQLKKELIEANVFCELNSENMLCQYHFPIKNVLDLNRKWFYEAFFPEKEEQSQYLLIDKLHTTSKPLPLNYFIQLFLNNYLKKEDSGESPSPEKSYGVEINLSDLTPHLNQIKESIDKLSINEFNLFLEILK